MLSLRQRIRHVGLLAAVWLAGPGAAAAAQQQVAQLDRPRFMQMKPGRPALEEVDVTKVEILRRRVSLDNGGATVADLLREITRQTGLAFAYNADAIAAGRPAQLRASSITVAAALTEILVDAQVDVVLKSPKQAVLLPRDAARRAGAVAGRVTDAETGAGVRGAEVYLERSRWRTVTDTLGQYRLADVDSGSYTLTVRRLGYAKQSRQVTVRGEREETVDVALAPVAAKLDELVTTATGYRRKLEIGNDITTINADSVMRTQPVASVTQLLEGRVPGLTVQHTSGAPGDPSRLRLRGPGSPLQNNDPIVIVDGIRVYAEQSASRSANLAGGGFAAPSPLDYIDPNSIETVQVLKGPSASTLYGQDAANGVIVITTKKGKAGPTRWTADARYGQTRTSQQYPELALRLGHVLGSDQLVTCPINNQAGSRSCVGDSIISFQLLNDPALSVLDKGHATGLTLGASGGTAALLYAVTGSYRDETGLPRLPDYEADRYRSLVGTAPPEWMQRPQHLKYWGVTTTLTARLGAQADLNLRMGLSRTMQQRSTLEQQLGALMTTYLDRASGIYYRRPGGGLVGSSFEPVTSDVLTNYFTRATDAANAFTNGAQLNWRPRSWLALTAEGGLDVVHRDDENFLPRLNAGLTGGGAGSVSAGQGGTVVGTIKVHGTANAPLRYGIQFRLGAGVDYTGRSISDLSAKSNNLPPGTSLLGTENFGIGRTLQDDATFGYFVEPQFGRGSTWLNLGIRRDGGSTYGSSIKLPTFPKINLTQDLAELPFFPFKNAVPVFRVRMGYGRSSRQPGPADRLRLYDVGRELFVDGSQQSVALLNTLGNPDLRPERETELEAGFDTELFDSRLVLNFSGYRKTTDDALLAVPVAPSVISNPGSSNSIGSGDNVLVGDPNSPASASVFRNIGRVRNIGFELSLNAQLLRSAPVTVSTQLIVSRNRNVVVALGPGVQPFYITGNNVDGGERVAAGYPLNGRWSRPILGFADANQNGVLEQSEILLGDTAVYVGSAFPNYTASLAPMVSLWRGAVQVSATFLYDDGLSQKNELVRSLAPFSAGWNVPGTSIAEQATVADLDQTQFGPQSYSDYNWIQTVSTFRFNSLSIGYRVPQPLARRLGAQTLNVLLEGTNLGLHSTYRGGLDPNVNAFPTGNAVTDNGVLPQPRSWLVRVNATY